ncbi:LysM peptidoglycan-binding domain-containing protein [Sphingomonas sp. ERG5]|uniref:LysM peptidoglycan-binding domain-containing protein n=1 Tax=Sphingomonas sp. ERG5 TaxID=1381597 RepID=UPI000B0C1914|nr:LysM peptidoglycan-binding domain-containing protein [Sphingomonas sp. ERG5]
MPALPIVDATNDRASRLFYDNGGRLIGTLDAEGYVSKIVYDNAGRKIETIARKNKPGTTTGDFATIFASAAADNAADIHNYWIYDARGLVRATIDGEGDLTRYRYTPNGLVDQVVTGQRVTPNTSFTLATLPANTTDTLNTLTSTFNAYGQVLTETRTLAAGTETTTYSYDAMRRLVSKTTASNVAADKRISSWRYDTRGRLTGELSGEGSAVLAALGATPTQAAIDSVYARYGTCYLYDEADRLIARIDPDGVGEAGLKTLYYYDAADRLAHQINALGEVVSYVYNAFGQVEDTIVRSTRVNGTTLSSMTGGSITAAVISAIVVDNVLGSDGLADSHRRLFYNVDGTVAKTSDALGVETRFNYNAFREWTSRIDTLTAAGSPTGLTERTTIRAYDQRGLMEAETLDATGAGALALLTGFTYDAFGRVIMVTDPNLHSIQTSYDRAGRVAKVTDALLRDTGYTYDGRGNVVKIKDRNGKDTTFSYDAFNRSVVMTTPEGLMTTSTVNAYGQKISVSDPAGRTSTWSYDKDGNLDITKDASGTTIADNQYDTAGRLSQTTDARGTVTRYTYDAANRTLTRTIDAGSGTLNLVTTYEYDAKGQQTLVTEASGTPEVRSTRIDYDLNGRKLAVLVDPGAGKLNLRTDYSYDAAGRLLSMAEGSGTTLLTSATAAKFTTYSYDDVDRLVQTTVDSTGLNLRTVLNYDKAGNLVARTDGSGTADAQITRLRYDANDRLTHSVDALGQVTGTVYDNEGRVIETRVYWTTMPLTGSTPLDLSQAGAPAIPATNANDRVTRYVYDGDGRLAYSIDNAGQITATVYDGSGNVTARTTYAVLLGSTAVTLAALNGFAATAANGVGARVTRMAYDSIGRLAYSVDAQGAVSKFAYDTGGNLLNRTDYAAVYTGTAALTLAAMDGFAATNATGANRITRMAYDAAGRMVASVDATGAATRITYDALGNVLKQTAYAQLASTATQPTATTAFTTSADDRTTQYIYDDAGRVTHRLDALNYLVQYNYNALDQVVSETRYANPLTVSGDFDTADLAALALSAADDRTTGYDYDKAGRLILVTDGEGFKTRTLYDALGRITDIKYAEGTADESVTHRVYDAANRLIDEITGYGSAEASKTHYIYDTLGQVTDITRGDVALSAAQSSTTHRTYDKMGRLASETRGYGSSEAATTGYGYDTLGRLTQETDPLNHTIVRTYDLMNRVTSISVPVDANAANNLVTLKQYNSFGDLEMVTDPALNKGYFYYDELGRVTLQVDAELYATATNYTAFGQIKDVTRYETRLASAPTAGVRPAMPAPNPNMGYSLGDATTRLAYDKLGQVTASTNALNQTENTSYNAFGERKRVANRLDGVNGVNGKTDYSYDRRGLLKSETLPVTSKNASGTSIAVVNSYSYDGRGNRTGMVEANGLPEQRTTAYTYDKLDRLTETRLIEDRAGKSFTILADGLNGSAATTSTQLIVKSISYDARGNIIRTTDGTGAKTTFYFDDLDRQTDQISAAGTLSHWGYDGNGNIVSSRVYATAIAIPATPGATAPAATNPTQYRETSFTYDFANRQTGTASLAFRTGAYDSVSSTYVTLTTAVTTQTDYDKLGNVVRQQDGNGYSIYSFYDKLGRRVAQVDQEKYLTSWVLDSDGNATTETRFARALTGGVSAASTIAAMTGDAGAANADNRVTTSEYDLNGQRIKQTRKNVVAWTVNMTNVVAAASDSTILFSYNGLGQVTQKVEANYDVTDYQYDGAGRLIQEAGATFADFDGGPAVRRATSYSYDGVNNLTGTLTGALGVVDAANDRTVSYTYDSAGRVATMTDAAGLTRSYLYDAAGHTTRQSYTRLNSAGVSKYDGIGYRYDAEGRVIAQAAGTRANATDPFSFDQASGGTTHMRYNAFGEMTGRGLTIGGAATYQETFEYDDGGRLWRSNAGDGVYRIYLYDKAGNQTLSLISPDINLSGVSDAGTIAANGTSSIVGSITTLTVYDKRGLAVATREPQRIIAAGAAATDIVRSRAFNAFGDLSSETDASFRTTDFKYNSMGRLIEKQAPGVSVTGTNGVATPNRPTERRYYDISGRLIGVKDANQVQADDATASTADDLQHIATRTLLAGTGHGDDEALSLQEFHLDGGVLFNAYDVLGNVRVVTDEISRPTSMVYDKGGRLTSVTHFGGLTDYYSYDGLGQRLTHWNSFLTGKSEKTDYDASGRVTAVAAFGDEAVTTSYTWDPTLPTGGLGTFGGWSLLTLNHGWGLRETSDYFDHVVTKTDMSGRVTTVAYDLAGRVKGRTITGVDTSASDNIAYTYFNTGLAASAASGNNPQVNTNWSRTVATYGYDVAGRKTSEKQVNEQGVYTPEHIETHGDPQEPGYWEEQVPESYYTTSDVMQNASATYDELGRMKTWAETGGATLPASAITWSYDAVGNIRNERADFHIIADNGSSSSASTKDQWFLYDAMNRVVTANAMLSNGQILGGTAVAYDAAGQRRSATNSSWFSGLESYSYDASGNLEHVKAAQGSLVDMGGGVFTWVYGAGVEKATFTYDGMNRLTRQQDWLDDGGVAYDRQVWYNDRGQVYYEVTSQKQGADFFTSTTTTWFDNGTLYFLGAPSRAETATTKNGVALPTSSTLYNYKWYENTVQSLVYYSPDKNRSEYYTTTYNYSGAGVFQSAIVADGRSRSISVISDVLGQAIRRDESGSVAPHEAWYRFNGMELGHVTNNGTGATDYQTSINSRISGQGSGGAFKNGSSTGLSDAMFGDGYAPITSFAQGAGGGSYTVRSGDTLSSIAAQVWGDANLWYKLGQANGLDQGSALTEGMVITIPAGVVKSSNSVSTFKPYDPSDAFGDTSPTTPKPQAAKKNNCGVFGAILLVVIAVAVTLILKVPITSFLAGGPLTGAAAATTAAGASLGATIAGGAIAAVAGSVVSQAVGLATGIQDKFSWKGVALAALAGGVSAGIGKIPGIDGLIEGADGAKTAVTGLKAVTSAIGRAVVGNVATQGIALATGLQNKFDWTGVAASAISGGVTQFVGGKLNLTDSRSIGNTLKSGLAGAAGSIASAATRSAINGSNFGDNIIAALPDAIGQTIGNLVANGVGTGFDGKSGKKPGGTSMINKEDATGIGSNDAVGIPLNIDLKSLSDRLLGKSSFGLALSSSISGTVDQIIAVGIELAKNANSMSLEDRKTLYGNSPKNPPQRADSSSTTDKKADDSLVTSNGTRYKPGGDSDWTAALIGASQTLQIPEADRVGLYLSSQSGFDVPRTGNTGTLTGEQIGQMFINENPIDGSRLLAVTGVLAQYADKYPVLKDAVHMTAAYVDKMNATATQSVDKPVGLFFGGSITAGFGGAATTIVASAFAEFSAAELGTYFLGSGTTGTVSNFQFRAAAGGTNTPETARDDFLINGSLGVAARIIAPVLRIGIDKIGAAETRAPGTIGNLLSDYHPDSFIHITPSAPREFAAGINEGTYFSRLGDVAHLTPEAFRTTVVGPLAPGYYPDAKLFVVVGREASGSFRALPPEAVNLSGTTEYVNAARLNASGFVKAR